MPLKRGSLLGDLDIAFLERQVSGSNLSSYSFTADFGAEGHAVAVIFSTPTANDIGTAAAEFSKATAVGDGVIGTTLEVLGGRIIDSGPNPDIRYLVAVVSFRNVSGSQTLTIDYTATQNSCSYALYSATEFAALQNSNAAYDDSTGTSTDVTATLSQTADSKGSALGFGITAGCTTSSTISRTNLTSDASGTDVNDTDYNHSSNTDIPSTAAVRSQGTDTIGPEARSGAFVWLLKPTP